MGKDFWGEGEGGKKKRISATYYPIKEKQQQKGEEIEERGGRGCQRKEEPHRTKLKAEEKNRNGIDAPRTSRDCRSIADSITKIEKSRPEILPSKERIRRTREEEPVCALYHKVLDEGEKAEDTV